MPSDALGFDTTEYQPGFYGKLPSRGDFVTRRLPRPFVEAWDRWMQTAVEASREHLGESWLSIYLTSPIWRFDMSAGLCGELPIAGVLMPSVDRVGRYFPLVVAVPLPDCGNAAALPGSAGDWFARLETIALAALDEACEFEQFDAMVESAGVPAYDHESAPQQVDRAPGWRVAVGPVGDVGGACAGMIGHALGASGPTYSVWWTTGSEQIEGSLVACRGLPPAGGFAAFLDGRWGAWGWGGDIAHTAADDDFDDVFA